MGLYIVYTPNIESRKANVIFFYRDGLCYAKRGFISQPTSTTQISPNDFYKSVAEIAQKKSLDSYEIQLCDDSSVPEALEYLSNYLLDKDISIGLIALDKDIIESNKQLIDSLGINCPSPIYINFEQYLLESSSYDDDYLENKKPVNVSCGVVRAAKPQRTPKSKLATSSGPRKDVASSKTQTINLEESFHKKFIKLLIESGKDNSEIYKKAGISRQVFSKILSGEDMIPTKLTLMSLCVGLELPFRQSKELMESAGYSFSRSIMLDSIIAKYLKEEVFDLDIINSELYEYGCPLLGWHPREK